MITSQRGGAFGPLASLRCLWAQAGDKSIYGPYERPPFPIQIDAPTWGDVLREIRMCDWFMGGALYGTGLVWAYTVSRPFPQMMQRLVVYHGVSHMILACTLSLMVAVPYRRLTGYWENGLRWSRPEDRLNKWDCTSHFEQATGWSRFKLSGNE